MGSDGSVRENDTQRKGPLEGLLILNGMALGPSVASAHHAAHDLSSRPVHRMKTVRIFYKEVARGGEPIPEPLEQKITVAPWLCVAENSSFVVRPAWPRGNYGRRISLSLSSVDETAASDGMKRAEKIDLWARLDAGRLKAPFSPFRKSYVLAIFPPKY